MSDYKPPTESEWKTLATTEITHLPDEERERFPDDWDTWLAQVRRDAAREALTTLAAEHEARSVGNGLISDMHLMAQQRAEAWREHKYPEARKP